MDASEARTGTTFCVYTLGWLYLMQGIPAGFALEALPAILRKEGMSLAQIGLMSAMVIVPWTLKFLWAPLVDNRHYAPLGRRRSWIVPLQVLSATILLALACLPDGRVSLSSLVTGVVVLNVLAATQDIAVDGYAADHLAGRERSLVNGFQIGGFSLGMLIGGGLALLVYDVGGWPLVLALLGSLLLLGVIPGMALSEESSVRDDSHGRPRASLRAFLRKRHAGQMLAVAMLFYFGRMLQNTMLKPYLVDSDLDLSTIGILSTLGNSVSAIVGGIAGGVLAAHIGESRTAIRFGLLGALSTLVWVVITYLHAHAFSVLLAATLLSGVTAAIAYAAFFAIFMRWATGPQAGTDFTTLQCTESLSNVIAAALSGILAERLGYSGELAAAALLGLAALLWIARWLPLIEAASGSKGAAFSMATSEGSP